MTEFSGVYQRDLEIGILTKQKTGGKGKYDYELSMVELAGQGIRDIYGYVSHEFEEPVFKITRIEMEDGQLVDVEGEHDFPYICDGGEVIPLSEKKDE